ncbi:MAG TPA: ATP-grasp fold amidoligase family protein [Lachnospiraceae bacterium]|nr:ATP-grasp fold amidoligase family protein [Lachnospiraceae bacterium]
MTKVRKIIKYLNEKQYRITIDLNRGKYDSLSDEEFIKLKFRTEFGYELDLNNPKSFNEKIQWLKLYNHEPIYTIMVDKYKVREYIADIIGGEYLIPLLGVWSKPEEISFESLPKRFVLKCNHNSGTGMYICRDKSQIDKDSVLDGLRRGLREDYYKSGREWPYKNVPRKIICEQYLTDDGPISDTISEIQNAELRDYKLMCFNGEVKCSFVCADRFSEKGMHLSFYDRDWNEMPFERAYPRIQNKVSKPKNYDKMVTLAEELSKDIPFVRVDFYEAGGKIYFGELTFFPGGGYEKFTPFEWDYTLGSWIKLPDKKSI